MINGISSYLKSRKDAIFYRMGPFAQRMLIRDMVNGQNWKANRIERTIAAKSNMDKNVKGGVGHWEVVYKVWRMLTH